LVVIDMNVRVHFALFILLLTLSCVSIANAGDSDGQPTDAGGNPVTPFYRLNAEDYCQGCQNTVLSFSKLLAEEFKTLKRASQTERKRLDSSKVMQTLCVSEEMQRYGPAVGFSCNKLLTDHPKEFSEAFEGSTKSYLLTNKKEVYNRKMSICVDIAGACTVDDFNDDLLVGTKRNKCAACHVVAKDFEAAKNYKNETISLATLLEDDFCDNMGFNHVKNSWFESVCDEMVEERADDMIAVAAFFDQVASNGVKIQQTLPQMMCEDLYGCTDELVQDKSKIKKKGKKTKQEL